MPLEDIPRAVAALAANRGKDREVNADAEARRAGTKVMLDIFMSI